MQQLDAELANKITSSTDSKLAEIDQKLDRLLLERRRNRERTASAREKAEVIIKDMEKLQQETRLLLEEIKEKQDELKKLYCQNVVESQLEKKDLQERIKSKENELQEAKARLVKKEEQLNEHRKMIRGLQKGIQEGLRELEERDIKIMELEKDKAEVVADLESERRKVRDIGSILKTLLAQYHFTNQE